VRSSLPPVHFDVLVNEHLPFLDDIISFLSLPHELSRLCYIASRSLSRHSGRAARQQWEELVRRKWPNMYECIRYRDCSDWKECYRGVASGRTRCTLEVFEREKKLGFAMSRLPAHVNWEAKTNSYIARYLSASEVLPERIPASEEHRLLFCPAPVRSILCLPRFSGEHPLFDSINRIVTSESPHEKMYPYRVLEGIADDFCIGCGIELQWKMQRGSPFGWWYGVLERLEYDANGVTAVAKIAFRHFPANSNWHWLDIRFGDGGREPAQWVVGVVASDLLPDQSRSIG